MSAPSVSRAARSTEPNKKRTLSGAPFFTRLCIFSALQAYLTAFSLRIKTNLKTFLIKIGGSMQAMTIFCPPVFINMNKGQKLFLRL